MAHLGLTVSQPSAPAGNPMVAAAEATARVADVAHALVRASMPDSDGGTALTMAERRGVLDQIGHARARLDAMESALATAHHMAAK